ncbi:MAG: outer membrane beta-barrel protein [Bacteroidota bacterium]|nr:outer membrane beta-barrel protein [Bacteroidota bacterium]
MDEDLHNIEELFHSALDDDEEMPSQNVWDGVEKRLDKDNIISINKKYINIKRLAILLLLLLGVSIYEMNRIYHSHSPAKNDTPGRQHQWDSKRSIGKATDVKGRKMPGVPAEPVGTYNTAEGDEQNSPRGSKIQKSGNNEKEAPSHNSLSQDQNTLTKINAQNNLPKVEIISNASKKRRLTSKTFYKTKNAITAYHQESNARTKGEPVIAKSSFSESLKNRSIENSIFEPGCLIEINKNLPPLLALKINTFDILNNNVVTRKRKGSKRLSPIAITPFFSPDIAWYHLQDDNINNQSGNANDIEQEEKHGFSSTYGALIDYKINNHWSLQSGITLSNTNITTDPEIIYAQPDNTGNVKYRINTSSGYGFILPAYSANPGVGDSLYAVTSSHLLRYIGIPLAAVYSVAEGKFIFSARAGASVNFLTKGKIVTTVEKGLDNSTETADNIQGLKKVYYTGLAGLGIDFRLGKKTAITFAPTLRFALVPINKNTTVKSYPTTFGSSVGFKMQL